MLVLEQQGGGVLVDGDPKNKKAGDEAQHPDSFGKNNSKDIQDLGGAANKPGHSASSSFLPQSLVVKSGSLRGLLSAGGTSGLGDVGSFNEEENKQAISSTSVPSSASSGEAAPPCSPARNTDRK